MPAKRVVKAAPSISKEEKVVKNTKNATEKEVKNSKPKKVETVAKVPKESAQKREKTKISSESAASSSPSKVVDVPKETVKKVSTKKTAVKKATTKKTKAVEKKESVVVEEKPKKATTRKKTTGRKTPTKKSVEKKEEKKPEVAKMDQYKQFSLNTCIDMAKAMGIGLEYDQYAQLLMDSVDVYELANRLIQEHHINPKAFSYEEDGYDVDLIPVLLDKVADTVEVKASDFDKIAQDIHEELKKKVEYDADAYNNLFDLVKKYLMIAQKKHISSIDGMKDFVDADGKALIVRYMDVAYQVLKVWQYEDVKYYENFIYAVLSQFEELVNELGNRCMMDVADLYIEHGDSGLGDADYQYILRENDIKDYIYLRFAKVYLNIDRNKAKSIAYEAMQYVDERFTYYKDLKEILNK